MSTTRTTPTGTMPVAETMSTRRSAGRAGGGGFGNGGGGGAGGAGRPKQSPIPTSRY